VFVYVCTHVSARMYKSEEGWGAGRGNYSNSGHRRHVSFSFAVAHIAKETGSTNWTCKIPDSYKPHEEEQAGS